MRRIIHVALALVSALTLSVCSSSEPFTPDDEEDPEPQWSDPCAAGYPAVRMTVIGPEGGMVDIYDHPDAPSDLGGFQLVVPAGAWSECWEVEIASTTYGFDTPSYPSGFVPAARDPEGSIELAIFRQTEAGGRVYAPDSMYMELQFPLKNIPVEERGYVFAFMFDDAAMDWRLLLPDAATSSRFIVHSSNWKRQWSFGSIDLADVDIQRYLTPAMVDRIGSVAWSRIRASIDSVYDEAVSQTSVLSCFGLNVLEGFFVSARNRSATALQTLNTQANCGACDATTKLFWDEWRQYANDKSTEMILDMVLDVAGGPGGNALDYLIDETVGLVTGELMDLIFVGDYSCDYECFFDATDWTFFFFLAVYEATPYIIDGIDWYRQTFTTCSVPPPSALGWSQSAASPFLDGPGCRGTAPSAVRSAGLLFAPLRE